MTRPLRSPHPLRSWAIGCLALAQAVACLVCSAATPQKATIPYKVIARVLDSLNGIKERDRLILRAQVLPASANPGSEPIQLAIQSRDGAIPLQLSASGELEGFPLTANLRSENPPVVSNQPKGTLTLRASISIRFSGRLEESAAWYVEALGQANAAIKSQAGALSFLAPKLKSLVVVFPTNSSHSLRLISSLPGAAALTLAPDPTGRVRVNLPKPSDAASMTLSFSDEPIAIEAE